MGTWMTYHRWRKRFLANGKWKSMDLVEETEFGWIAWVRGDDMKMLAELKLDGTFRIFRNCPIDEDESLE